MTPLWVAPFWSQLLETPSSECIAQGFLYDLHFRSASVCALASSGFAADLSTAERRSTSVEGFVAFP